MKDLAKTFRASQLFAHSCHNLVRGSTFLADHPFLGDLYEAYEEAYDDVIERMIGLDYVFDINQITREAGNLAANYPVQSMDAKEMFSALLQLEIVIQTLIKAESKPETLLGVQDLIQGLADDSQMRAYKIKQRLKQ